MRLFSYVVARDYGFAPNPFGEYCTLATCKPEIRAVAQPGDWVVGTGSATRGRQGHLVYAMQIQHICSFNDYWNAPQFGPKKPNLAGSKMKSFGDNIYWRDKSGRWHQSDSHHSHHDGSPNCANIVRDTKTDRVLISAEFVYFGGCGPDIPEPLRNYRGFDLCKSGPGHRGDAPDDMIREFISWYRSFDKRGLAGWPVDWDRSQ